MKSFILGDIIGVLGGELAYGTREIKIDNIPLTAKGIIAKSMYFDFYKERKINLSLFNKTKGAAVITNRPESFKSLKNNIAVVKVADVDKAYWNFIYYYRSLFDIPVIGITGTCGKSTTKEMVRHILSQKYKVQATYKSNNGAGLSWKYLLGIDDSTGAAVFELGIGSPGEMTKHLRYFKPQIRVLLNIGVYHLDLCKTPEEYIKAKGEIVKGLDKLDGTLILNADDDNIKKIDISKIRKIIYFGIDRISDYRASNISYSEKGMNFTLNYKGNNYTCFVPGFGKHNVYNALAAIASTVEAGLNIREAIENLKSFQHLIEHLQFKTGSGDCTVIDDTWSSAPPSVEAALNVMAGISGGRKKIAIIGTSPLLGDNKHAKEQYSKIGDKVVEAGTDILIVADESARQIGLRALELGMNKDNIYFTSNGHEIYDIISRFLNKHTIILLKVTHRQMIEESFKEFKSSLLPS